MTLNRNIILELKNATLKSRYQAARLVNKELIVLYFGIGKRKSETATREAWGSKVLEQISTELQSELPGLRGFSSGNLKKMRVFAEFWMADLKFGSALPNHLLSNSNEFSSVSFTHQYSIASKCEHLKEAYFYLKSVATEFWNYRHLEKQIVAKLVLNKNKLYL